MRRVLSSGIAAESSWQTDSSAITIAPFGPISELADGHSPCRDDPGLQTGCQFRLCGKGAMDLNLKDRVVVITGGASGIGRATALAFASEGAHIAVWDLDKKGARLSDEIRAQFPVQSIGIAVDVTDHRALQGAVDRTVEVLGPIDHVVHAAAIGSGKFGFPFTNLEPGDWPRVLQVNVMGMVHVAHAGQIGSQTDPPYSASKAANINFAQCLAKDFAPHNIRVNTVCPGMVQTPLNRLTWQAWHDQSAPQERLTYEEWGARKVRSMVPLGKWQTPEAIADMIVFLSSDRAAHVTGQTINVDGGFVMHW
jgi:2-hydroxycyclohexanecarboxyl-CoA dehydrogenase